MRPLQWWAESAPLDGDRVKVSENLGATSVTPVAPLDTSLLPISNKTFPGFLALGVQNCLKLVLLLLFLFWMPFSKRLIVGALGETFHFAIFAPKNLLENYRESS